MLSRALALFSKLSSKLLHEVLPVALASVIGTMLVNHYSRQTALPVVIQTQPPAAADQVLRTLAAEHEIIVDYLKRDADARQAAATPVRPSAQPAAEERPAKDRLSLVEKSAPLPPSRPAAVKDVGWSLARPVVVQQPTAPVAVIEPAVFEVSAPPARRTGVVETARDWAATAVFAPARAFAWASDHVPTPHLPFQGGLTLWP